MPSLTLEETARRLIQYQQVESLLFEVMGGWSCTVAEPEVKLALSAHAQEHAWHATLWRDRLPALAEPGNEGGAPFGLGEFGLALRAHGGLDPTEARDRTVENLVGIYRVLLPHIIVAYSRHLAEASPLSDAPVTRALKLVLNDEVEEWRQGEGLVQDVLTSSDAVSRAAAHQGRLESILLESQHEGGQPLRR